MSIIILLAQLVSPNLVGVASSVGTSSDNGKIEVKKVNHDQDAIDWEITINQVGEENEGVLTDVKVGPGLTYGTIESVPNLKMKKTQAGYEIQTPAGKEKYVINLTTTISDRDQIDYGLQAISVYEENEFTAAESIKVIPDINIDLQASIAWVNVPEGEKPSTTVHVINEQKGEIIKSSTLSNAEATHVFKGLSKYDSKGQINQYSVKSDAVENYETTIEKYAITHTSTKSEEAQKPEVEEEVEDQKVKEELQKPEVVEETQEPEVEALENEEDLVVSEDVLDESEVTIGSELPLEISEVDMLMEDEHDESATLSGILGEGLPGSEVGEDYITPFLGTNRGSALRSGATSNLVWPNPGAIDLDKVANPTGKYGEWEINLTVQGKNIETSSDVVLVFDKSGSMNDYGRLSQAKTAAKKFVNALLTEDSNTRIALVTFNNKHNVDADFTGFSNKQSLLNSIDKIVAIEGTNIQSGLHQGQVLLNGSNAENKSIVLLSDGAPTYSFKARNAVGASWPGNMYRYLLSNFDYSTVFGSGHTYLIENRNGNQKNYTINRFTVTSHGIPTLSEAKHIMNAGTTIYSVGLDVRGDTDATYVLNNSQNGGSFIGGVDDLSPAFNKIASSIRYAAKDAIVTDPMGDMFDLVMAGKTISPEDYTISQGSMKWNPATETFDWHVGNIVEGTPVTLTYKVKMDFAKNPLPKTNYPTNKETFIKYEDVNGDSAKKNFPIPEVSIDSGSILKRGYLVNIDDQPINLNGTVVSSRQLAYQFYSEYHAKDGKTALNFGETYSINANDVSKYTLIVGDDPTLIDLQTNNPSEVVWFGYVDTTKLKAGDVTATYVDKDGNEIASLEVLTGNIGASYTTVQKDIEGYVFKEMGQASAPVSGTFKVDPQKVVYIYEKLLGSITVTKVDAEDAGLLSGAKFELQDMTGNVVREAIETNDNGRLIFEDLDWGDYQLVETKAPDGYRMLTKKINLTIEKEDLHIEKTVENTKNGWEIPETGGFGTLGFYVLGGLLMAYTLMYFIRKRKTNT